MVNPYIARTRDYRKRRVYANRVRIPFLQREKAAIIMLRCRHNWSYTAIKMLTGRALSTIHGVLEKAIMPVQTKKDSVYRNAKSWSYRKRCWLLDLRKLPKHFREANARTYVSLMDFLIQKWTGFILGTEDKPP